MAKPKAALARYSQPCPFEVSPAQGRGRIIKLGLSPRPLKRYLAAGSPSLAAFFFDHSRSQVPVFFTLPKSPP